MASKLVLQSIEEPISWRTKTKAKHMKVNLLTGKDKMLSPPPPKKRKAIPEEVETIALKHRTNTTIPEPSVHRRMKRRENKGKKMGVLKKLFQPDGSICLSGSSTQTSRRTVVKRFLK